MDTLFNGHGIQLEDLKDIKFPVRHPLTLAEGRRHWTGKCWRIDSRAKLWETYHHQRQQHQQQAAQPSQVPPTQDWLRTVEAAAEDSNQWGTWLDSQKLFDATSVPADGSLDEGRLAIVVSSPVFLTGLNKLEDGPTALRYSAVQPDCLLLIAQRLFIHQTYISLLEEGSPCALRIDSTVQGRPCQVYLLRTSNAVRRQSAIAVTYFPPAEVQMPNGDTVTVGARTNAVISGYDAADLSEFTSNLKRLNHFPSAPSRLVVSFLEIEKERRFHQVRNTVREMQTVLHELAREPVTEAPSARRKLNQTVNLYFVVHHLRTDGLVSWRDQLKMLRDQLVSGADKDMAMYLEQQVYRYDHRIGRCDMVLQGVSLAYQMETTQLSRKDTEIAIGDGKTMKAIAVLTMVFLPGTFIATMLAVPQIEKALDDYGSFGDAKWLWYVVLALPVTFFALLAYAAWEYLYKRKYLKSQFGAESHEKEDDMEMMSDLESNRSSLSLSP
ncbi:hypothetical protein B0T25DRAFT_548409 [Lasiosphaeria hispida]|uniref:Uncharacterized protein n=1 Tax=Lasiosphaeria hispida TaxID=260671 RepID=A0AAJ0HEU5_9PEZI|nr:hypothetical protein B0T25DRAFT_548409 [Lasiosphaeria hispida]